MKKWKVLKSELVFTSEYLNIRKDYIVLPSGKKGSWTYLDSNDSVMAVVLTKDKKLVIERQYRYLVGREVIQLPAGGIDDNETQEEALKRELKEETGIECKKFTKIGSFYETFTQLNRQIHVYFVFDVEVKEFSVRGPEYEETTIELFDFEKAVDMVVNNKIIDGPSALAILLLKEKIDRGEIKI